MGRKTKYKNVGGASKSSIEITFYYPTKATEHRRRHRLTAVPSDANLLKAYNFLCQINESIANGSFDYAKTFPESKIAQRFVNRRLLGTYLKHWIANQVHLKAETRRNYLGVVNNINNSKLKSMRLVDLTWGDIRDWALDMDVTPKTRSKRVAVIRTALNDAVDDGLINTNPTMGRKLKQTTVVVQKEKVDPFSWAERDAIEAACCHQFMLMVRFWLFTGLRPEEIRGLQWEKVNFVEKNVYIDQVITDASNGKFEPPKTPQAIRHVDLIEPALDALRKVKQYTFMQGGFVFVNPFDQKPFYRTDNIRNRWKTALKKAGVRYRPPSQMRHTYASTALTEGEDIADISKQLGHKKITVTLDHYARYIPENRKGRGSKVMEAWQQYNAGKKLAN